MAINALGPIFPPGFNRIRVRQITSDEQIKGTTVVSGDGRAATVKINTDSRLPEAVQRGLYTHSVAHELFLHAQSLMETRSLKVRDRTQTDDHRRTYLPRTDKNGYLEAMRRVFDGLQERKAKLSFAHAFQEDIRMQSEHDDDLGQIEFEQIDLWSSERRSSLEHAIDHREQHPWPSA